VELLTYLDGNLSSNGLDDPNLVVTKFHLPWWSGPRAHIKHTTYLSFSTLRAALAEHRMQLEEASKLAGQADFRGGEDVNKTFYSWHPEIYADLDTPCTRCRLYRAVTFGTVDRLRDAENKSQGLAVANRAEADIGMRRSSGFYELYAEVLKKEVELEKGPFPGSGTGSGADPDSDSFSLGGKKGKARVKVRKGKPKVSEVAEHVRTEAERQLRVSGAFGQVESKWTWGVDLNSQDIWEMTRGADKGYKIPHSGYDDDLRTGKLRSSSPIPSPNDIEDPDDPDILFDELTHVPFIRDLRPDEVPIEFSFPTLHYRAAGESGSGLEPPPSSSSEHTGQSDEDMIKKRHGKQAMHDEVNSPEKPSTSDSLPIIPKRSPPHRPWLGPPPQDYIRPPTQTSLFRVKNLVSIRVPEQRSEIADDDLEHMSGPDRISKPDLLPEPELPSEPEHLLLRHYPRNLDQLDVADNSLDSDIAMHVDTSSGSDGEIKELRMTAEDDSPTGIYGLVVPDLSDDSDGEICIGDLGRETVDVSMRVEDNQVGTFALIGPDSPDDSDKEIGVGNLGLVAPDIQSDSGEEIEVGNLGLDSVEPGMWAETVVDEGGIDSDARARARARVRIALPRVNPVTGHYTADSFANIPDDWFD
jgi:hypothetical protein